MLKSYTKGKNSAKNRPKLYFCSHPEDVNKYLRTIADEIFEKQPDVAIWYNDEPDIDEMSELHVSELSLMQAFIVPVTNKFLSAQNRGLADFRYAVENKIPILPLLQEPGLEGKFNEVCGNFQILEKNNKDQTTISYEVKLERFLKTHIVDENIVKELRKAFCAFVFVSYRKKNRRYAQEIMKTLHSVEEFKDIGIWYDEFLSAGEPFDEIIRKTIDESDFVLFAVTPDFLEEGNYIQKKPDGEYLYSKKKHKVMIPIEMLETDQAVLKDRYLDFPDCINNSQEELELVIKSQLERLSIVHKPNDVLHTYMLGLAYINGIHVEIDKQRGINYIESAYYSDQGIISIVPEASKMLAEIYYWGNGVTIDYRKSAEFQLEYCKYLLSKNDSIANNECLIRELYWLAEICLEPVDGDRSRVVSKRIAVEAYRESCERCEKIITSGNSSDEILNYYAIICISLAQLLYEASSMYENEEDKRTLLRETEAMYRKCISILESNPSIHKTTLRGRFLNKSYAYFSFARNLPGMAIDQEDILKKTEESIEFFKKAYRCEDLADIKSIVRIVDYYREIVYAYCFLSEYNLAIEYYKKIVTIYESLPEEHISYDVIEFYMILALNSIVNGLIESNHEDSKKYIKEFVKRAKWKFANFDDISES